MSYGHNQDEPNRNRRDFDPTEPGHANVYRGASAGPIASHGGPAGPHSTKTSGVDNAKDQHVRAGDELEQAMAALFQRLESAGVLKDQPMVSQDRPKDARPTALSGMARFIDSRTDHLRALTGKVTDLLILLDI